MLYYWTTGSALARSGWFDYLSNIEHQTVPFLLIDGHVCGLGIVYDIVRAFFGGEFFPTPVSTDFEGDRLLKKQMKSKCWELIYVCI